MHVARALAATFAGSLPSLRGRDELIAAISSASSGRASDAQAGAIAEIELLIADGDRNSRMGTSGAALAAFEKARAEIYRLIYPTFDVRHYLASDRVALTVSADIEQRLLGAATQMIEAARPAVDAPRPPAWVANAAPARDELVRFSQLGLRETEAADELLQRACEHGVALLAAGRPEAGLQVLEGGLNASGRADPALAAAVHLNRACALLQIGDVGRAVEASQLAGEQFSTARDQAGIAQAAHLKGIAALRRGDNQTAESAFAQAAEIAGRLPPYTAPRGRPEDAASGRADAAVALSMTVTSSPISGTSAAAVRSLAPRWSTSVSRDPAVLAPLTTRDANTVTYRIPGRADGWGSLPLLTDAERAEQAKPWSLGVTAGAQPVQFELSNRARLSADDVAAKLYQSRIAATDLVGLTWSMADVFSSTLYLTHLYAYVLPLKIGDAYAQQRLFAKAEQLYLQAAAYSYLNTTIEATVLWVRLARNAVEWGDALYREENLDGAKAQYAKVVTEAGAAPASALYSTASLGVPAGIATQILAQLNNRPFPLDDWEIAEPILKAFGQFRQILAGFDFYGLLLAPIHTFEYLQNVAEGFAREAIQAESQYVNFIVRQQTDEAARRELETAKAMAEAEADSRYQMWQAAIADEKAAQAAADLAGKRVEDAEEERAKYQASSASDLWARAASQALSGGQDAYVAEITELANKLDRGETIQGPGPKLAAAETLAAGRRTQKYELQKMQDTIDELKKNKVAADEQYSSAQAHTTAAELQYQAALKRAELAAASLEAFDGNLFGPESWAKMAGVMKDIAQGYLFRGIRLAKLMERAYNFERDTTLKLIKNDYGIGVANATTGASTTVLGGDLLLSDVLSFTYAAITSRVRKSCRIKDVLSIASMFPAQFDTFRQTGRLTFETDLYEFDRMHPGFFGQRLHGVELEVVGLLPESGIHGTLTAGGVTSFRRADGTTATRVQVIDTLALSEYTQREDGLMYTADTGVKGLFQGFGVGATWELHLPRRSNDLDLRRIFDIRLVLYYTAEYDRSLEASILAAPVRPGELAWVRDFGLRYDFPDAWYGFYKAGTATVNLERLRLPMNQTNFSTEAVHARVITKEGVVAQGIQVRLTAPGGATGSANTDADGVVSSGDPALAALVGVNPVGPWQVQVVGGAPLDDGGTLRLDRVYNIQLGFDYTFDYLPEG